MNQSDVIPKNVNEGLLIHGKPVILCLVTHGNMVLDSCECYITMFGAHENPEKLV